MDYIDRKALRDALYDADAITMNGVKILNQFPAADVAPVRHGKWLHTEIEDDEEWGGIWHKWLYGLGASEIITNNKGILFYYI